MMFKEKSISKLYAFALAAVFALTLAGCGGGGGTAAVEEPPAMPDSTPQEMCEDDGGRYNADGSCTSAADLAEEMALSGAQSAAMHAASAAMAAVGAAKDPVASSNAYSYAAMAKTASDSAAMATTSAMAMEYQTAAETARDKAVEAAGMRGLGITQLANKITNQAAIDNDVLEGKTGSDVTKPVSNATRVGAEILATATALVGQTDVTSGEASPSPGSVAQGGEASATATYNAAGPRFTVTAGTGAVLRGESPTSLMTAGEKPSGGWPGAELVRTDATPGQTYVLAFTDITAPSSNQNYDTTNAVAATDIAGGVITGDIPGDGSTFAGTYNADDDDNAPPVSGRFFCAADASCAISVDEDGEVTGITGYVFQALAAGATPASDDDYMAWGVWLTVPDATTATDLAAAGAFASGNDVFQVRAELTGTATYNGDASGMYSAGGMVEYFDADVSLTANFGGAVGADSTPDTGTVGDNDGLLLGAVTGTVSNIRAGGMDVDGMLTLKRAPINTTAANGDSTGGFDGAAEGTLGGAVLKGNWGGQFYGPNDATADSMAARTEYPTTAAGTFGATGGGHSPVSILGAFGAWKAE